MEHRIDAWLLLAVCAVLGTSLMTLHSVAQVIGGQLFVRQLAYSALGLLTILAMSRIHVTVYERLAPGLYGFALAVLAAVLVLGQERAGTRGWFALGPVTLQPSEFARVATMLVMAAWLARRSHAKLGLREVVAASAIVAGPVLLILFEPDLGVALTYLPLLGAALWLGGVSNRLWVVLTIVLLAGAAVAWHTALRPYQKERVLTILDPGRDPYGAGYQVRQSKIAVGSGGFAGEGLGKGSQSLLRFLPAQHTDFVFAAWAEATGFVGATALLLAYGLLVVRVGMVAGTAESRFGLAVVTLVGSWLSFQLVVNLGMVLGWLPTTGITLPLFSYGGSSLLSTCATLGVVQSVWRHRLVNQ